jgi:hypothetical protein
MLVKILRSNPNQVPIPQCKRDTNLNRVSACSYLSSWGLLPVKNQTSSRPAPAPSRTRYQSQGHHRPTPRFKFAHNWSALAPAPPAPLSPGPAGPDSTFAPARPGTAPASLGPLRETPQTHSGFQVGPQYSRTHTHTHTHTQIRTRTHARTPLVTAWQKTRFRPGHQV